MPRAARLDIAGQLQHVIARGIERRDIFADDSDREAFFLRFTRLLGKMEIECLAWAFMSNHIHLLLRPRQDNLALFMRRLLTGHAVTFNLRHNRSGHLFQNRYKSIVCEADAYLLELVRYIHLNPLRAGLVSHIETLKEYRWSGHSVIMGTREMAGQNVDEVLMYFSRKLKSAREKYEAFVADGIGLGKRAELVGGGLKRVLTIAGNEVVSAYDERILGSGEFVERLRQDLDIRERFDNPFSLPELVQEVADLFAVDAAAVSAVRRGAVISKVKSVVSYLAVRRLKFSGEAVAKALGMTRSGVCRGAERGSRLLQEDHALKCRVDALVNKSTTSP